MFLGGCSDGVGEIRTHGTGSETMKRIAAPMVGGMITTTLLTLAVIPAIYLLWRRWGLPRTGKELVPQ